MTEHGWQIVRVLKCTRAGAARLVQARCRRCDKIETRTARGIANSRACRGCTRREANYARQGAT